MFPKSSKKGFEDLEINERMEIMKSIELLWSATIL